MKEAKRVNLLKLLMNKAEQAVRLLILHYGSTVIPMYLVTEYPKSGGTWLSQMVSDSLCLPFPRNRIPIPRRSLFHGHYLPSRSFGKLKKIIWLVRDGRDVVVSSYFHGLIWNEKTVLNPKSVLRKRKLLGFADYSDVKANLPAYIEFLFTHVPSELRHFTYSGNWSSFNDNWLNQKFISPEELISVRYEDLLASPLQILNRIVISTTFNVPARGELEDIVDRFSFQTQTGRRPGEENRQSFIRKGVAGDWKNYFSAESAKLFNQYAGKTLIKLGYEPDDSWVDRW